MWQPRQVSGKQYISAIIALESHLGAFINQQQGPGFGDMDLIDGTQAEIFLTRRLIVMMRTTDNTIDHIRFDILASYRHGSNP